MTLFRDTYSKLIIFKAGSREIIFVTPHMLSTYRPHLLQNRTLSYTFIKRISWTSCFDTTGNTLIPAHSSRHCESTYCERQVRSEAAPRGFQGRHQEKPSHLDHMRHQRLWKSQSIRESPLMLVLSHNYDTGVGSQ